MCVWPPMTHCKIDNKLQNFNVSPVDQVNSLNVLDNDWV